jgi:hypothetical protein
VNTHFVHHAVDHNRVRPEAWPHVVARRIKPHLVELRNVAAVDLWERGILRRIGSAQMISPGGVRLCCEGGGEETDETEFLYAHSILRVVQQQASESI